MKIIKNVMCLIVIANLHTGIVCAAKYSPIDAEYATVNNAVLNAKSGDTIIMPKDTATWASPLIITKGISIVGAGIDKTYLKCNFSDDSHGVITYQPDNATKSLNPFVLISGLTIDVNNNKNGVYILNDGITPISKVRIDSLRILNANRGIFIAGSVFGVADNNKIESCYHGMDAEGYGGGRIQWENLPREYGTANNFYFEDNVFIMNNKSGPVGHAGGHGGRWVARYNEYRQFVSNANPVFDAHGNQYAGGINGIYGTMITEWYGNSIDLGDYGAGTYFDHRGGWSLFFNNNIKSTNSTTQLNVREEFCDSVFPAPNHFVMKVANSYYWNNRKNTSKLLSTLLESDLYQREPDVINNPPQLQENREFYNQNTAFNGTTGVGCGSLSKRPTTCTPGVAYWATDQPCDSCWSKSLGPHPEKPITGTLYKCVEKDKWEAYYSPYEYPHPFRKKRSLQGIGSYNR